MFIENNCGSQQEDFSMPFFEMDYQKCFDAKGNPVIPAIIVNAETQRNLMLGFMTKQAYIKSWERGKVTFWTRDRQELWLKGETSGNRLKILSWEKDCDSDTLEIFVKPLGPTCHRGTESCFDNL